MPLRDATRAARVELGSLEEVKDRIRDVGWETRLESVWRDARFAFRAIRRAPGISVVVTLTIALGVGATTGIFSVVDAVLLRPLPYPAQASLVKLFDTNRGRDAAVLSFPEFIDWRDRGGDVFESVGAFSVRGEALSGAGEAELAGKCAADAASVARRSG